MLSARSQFSFRIPGQHRFEVLDARGLRELCVQPSQVRVRLDAVTLGRFDERVLIGARTCASLCYEPAMQASHCSWETTALAPEQALHPVCSRGSRTSAAHAG